MAPAMRTAKACSADCRRLAGIADLGDAGEPLVAGGHAGQMVEDAFVDAQPRLRQAGADIECTAPMAQRPQRRQRVPVRLREQRQRQRVGELNRLRRRKALRCRDGLAQRAVDLDAGGQHEQLGLERRQVPNGGEPQCGGLETLVLIRRCSSSGSNISELR